MDCLSIHLDSKKFLVAMVAKMLEKSPLQQSLVRSLGWLIPSAICNQDKHGHCLEALRRFLTIAVEAGQVQASNCDKVIKQYRNCLTDWA